MLDCRGVLRGGGDQPGCGVPGVQPERVDERLERQGVRSGMRQRCNACTTDVCTGTGACSHPSVAGGTSCGSGQVCNAAGSCGNGCWIAGAYYAAGAANPGAECQVCNPSVSTSSWSAKASGAACSSDGNACTTDVCNGAGSCGHPFVAAGTSCGPGLTCNGAGACMGHAGCSGGLVAWTGWQWAWGGNPATGGTYFCRGYVSGASDGDTVYSTPTSATRSGWASFSCNNGSWEYDYGSCDGNIVNTASISGIATTCYDADPVRSKWIGWYKADLKRCADVDGLNWWVDKYNNDPVQCSASDNYNHQGSKDACWRSYFQDAANLNGNSYNQAQNNGYVSTWDETNLCGSSAAYPHDSSIGTSCKYEPSSSY